MNLQKARRLAKKSICDKILNCGNKIEKTRYYGKKYGKHIFLIEITGKNIWELKKVKVSDKMGSVESDTVRRIIL